MGHAERNAAVWRAGRYVSDYDKWVLDPPEVLLFARYRDAFTGRVLDVGCGAGRWLRYLVAIGADAHGIDISPAMVAACRSRWPTADVRVADLTTLPGGVEGPFDVVLMSGNVIDVLDDGERRAALSAVRALLAPEGLLVFSSHNLTAWERGPLATRPAPSSAARWWSRAALVADRSPAWMLGAVRRLPRRRANRRRLAPLQSRAGDHAIVNDDAHDYSLLHYYIGRDAQERQLADLGYRLLEVRDADGSAVAAGEGRGASLYYVAASG